MKLISSSRSNSDHPEFGTRKFNHQLRQFMPAAHSFPVSVVDYHFLPLLFTGIHFISKARFFLALNSPMTLLLNLLLLLLL